jgi:hypothetical protein
MAAHHPLQPTTWVVLSFLPCDGCSGWTWVWNGRYIQPVIVGHVYAGQLQTHLQLMCNTMSAYGLLAYLGIGWRLMLHSLGLSKASTVCLHNLHTLSSSPGVLWLSAAETVLY